MAEEQIAGPLLTKELEVIDAIIRCTSLPPRLHIRNLADLKNLDPWCKSKSGEKLAQLIWFHNIEALEPMEKACRNNEVVSQLRHYLEIIRCPMKPIWEAYKARRRHEFETRPQFVSSLSTMELLLRMVIESQEIKNIVGPQYNSLAST